MPNLFLCEQWAFLKGVMSVNPLSRLCFALLQVALIMVQPVTFCFTLPKAKPLRVIFYWEKEKFSDLDVCSISICPSTSPRTNGEVIDGTNSTLSLPCHWFQWQCRVGHQLMSKTNIPEYSNIFSIFLHRILFFEKSWCEKIATSTIHIISINSDKPLQNQCNHEFSPELAMYNVNGM